MFAEVEAEFGTIDVFDSNARPELAACFHPAFEITHGRSAAVGGHGRGEGGDGSDDAGFITGQKLVVDGGASS